VSERELQPLGLVLKGGSWYVVAQTAGRAARIATYGVASMRRCGCWTKAARPGASIWHSTGRRRSGLRVGPAALTAQLRASAVGRWRLARLGHYAERAVTEAGQPDAEGWAAFALPFETTQQAALLLLSLGPEIEVLSPADLRAEVASLAKAVVRLHRAPPSDGA
jgi:predicted DNA-binding transcriptional regulator YafY